MPLSDTKIRALARPEKQTKVSDGGGLFLLLTPAGGKHWRYKYRIAGREKVLAIGSYPEVGLKDARERLSEARKLVAQGVDPSQAKQRAKRERTEADERTFGKVAERWYAKWRGGKADNTTVRVERAMKYALAEIGSVPVDRLKSGDIGLMLEKIESERTPNVARHVAQVTTQVLARARALGMVETNVATGVGEEVLTAVDGGHHPAVVESSALGEVLRTVWGHRGYGVVDVALKVLPYIFCRPGEMLSMRWADVDLDAAEWRHTTSKTGTPMVVPLARQVVELIRGLKPLTGRSEKVFGLSGNAMNIAMRRLGLDGVQTCHGWRATARTILDEHLGFRPDWIEAQLGHIVKDVNGRAYNRTSHLEGRRQMMQSWADYLDGLRLGEEKRVDNVVSLRKTG